ncbi:MAG: bifunctional hydroxymethylpyrimidine kinase/phosphomethylpyrimidine kinase [Solirubrobacteraceae bacterium]
MARVPVVLSIAGSDSGGGAGIQADLKAFARCGVHGATAITAITAQNTVAVEAVEAISPAMIRAQVRAVAADLGIDAVKIGMVGGVEAIATVAHVLDELPAGIPVVLDPVMVAESGARLLPCDAEDALRSQLLPRATVATPNVAEARVLAQLGEEASAEELVRAVHELGPKVAIVTGGHREEATDLLFDGQQVVALPGERHADGAAHGSGCTHSATLAARLALGDDPVRAARTARMVASEAVRDGLRELGAGPGPVHVLGAIITRP